jgi:hypothetical protein
MSASAESREPVALREETAHDAEIARLQAALRDLDENRQRAE